MESTGTFMAALPDATVVSIARTRRIIPAGAAYSPELVNLRGSGKSSRLQAAPTRSHGCPAGNATTSIDAEPRQPLQRFGVLGARACDHLRRQPRSGRGLVPVQRFQVVAHELLVVARRAGPDLVFVRGPVTRR